MFLVVTHMQPGHEYVGTALHLLTARLCATSEIWGKAREHYETSVRLDPNPTAYAELAELKAREGDIVKLRSPAGVEEIEVIEISYQEEA